MPLTLSFLYRERLKLARLRKMLGKKTRLYKTLGSFERKGKCCPKRKTVIWLKRQRRGGELNIHNAMEYGRSCVSDAFPTVSLHEVSL